jgi:hypothetical protein
LRLPPGEACDLGDLPLRQESISNSSLIEHLDGACMQASCPRANKVLVGAPLDNHHIDARQGQLAGQHQSCRPRSGDYRRVPRHCRAPVIVAAITNPAASGSPVDTNICMS